MAATELPDHHDTRHQFDVALESVKRDAVLIAGLVLENARRAGSGEVLYAFNRDLTAEGMHRSNIGNAVPFELKHQVPVKHRVGVLRIGQQCSGLPSHADRATKLQTAHRFAHVVGQRIDELGVRMETAPAMQL